jgi:UDP-2,3-diacylglucosamine pyrophosphatase LpxH
MRERFRTIFVSDAHLGSSAARAEELAYFLKHVECERIYLVGDVIDMWRLRRRWYWPKAHNDVVRRLLKHGSRGAEITYILGNHDDAGRQFHGLAFGGVRLALNAVHVTADGRRLLVTHGDQYDLVVRHSPLLSRLGGATYEGLIAFNRVYNRARAAFGRPYVSLSAAIKSRVKKACQFISRFEEELVAEARRGGFDGVVCGHIHKAEARTLDDDLAYLNCGDWVESCTALVEHEDGRFEVIDGLAFNERMRTRRAISEAIVEDEEPDPWLEAPPVPSPFDPRALLLASRAR